MKIKLNHFKYYLPLLLINILLLQNLMKIYEFRFVSNSLRFGIEFLIIFLSIFISFLSILNSKKNRLFYAFLFYLIITLLFSLVHNTFDYEIILQLTMIPCSFFVSFFYLRKCNKTDIIISLQNAFFVIFSFLYFYNKIFFHQAGAGRINSIYYLVLLLPFIISLKNKKTRIFLLLLLFVATAISLKRAALIVIIVGLFVYIHNNSKNKNRFLKLTIVGILFIIGLYFVQTKLNLDVINRLKSSFDDGGSGRMSIYLYLLNNIFSRGFLSFAIGDGFYGVINLVGSTAHNDFFEIFYDFGFIGLFFYINIYIQLFKFYFLMKHDNYRFSCQYLVSIISFFIMSTFSHVIMIPTYMMFICLFWGLVINDYYLFKGGDSV